jgi:hypothetical protein
LSSEEETDIGPLLAPLRAAKTAQISTREQVAGRK